MQNKIEENIKKFEEIADIYQDYQELISEDNLIYLSDFADKFKKTVSTMQEKKRKLKIGVVGQVKSGKSTFLNALLFDGKDLLPKAATPMTAALTVISYGEQPQAEVEFYSQSNWEKIKERTTRYKEIIDEKRNELGLYELSDEEIENMLDDELPDEIKASAHLVKKAKEQGINPRSYFGQNKKINANSIDDLLGKMGQYVGVDGKYTSLVKNSKLYINHQGLKGLEVVDTPGMNDPIVSRGKKTRKFLAACDVIFMLSYADQFMSKSDVRLITHILPKEGIKEIILLGSKFDTVLNGLSNKYQDYHSAKNYAKKSLSQEAQKVIDLKLKKGNKKEVYETLKKSLPPKFISGLAYNMALKPQSLSEEEEWVLNKLKKYYPDINFNRDFLLDLANIDWIEEEELPRIRKNKEQIMQEKFNNYIKGQYDDFKQKLVELKEEATKDLKDIKNSDLKELNQRQEKLKKVMKLAQNQIDMVFTEVMNDIRHKLSLFVTETGTVSYQYKNIKVDNRTEQIKEKQEKEGVIPWVKRKIGLEGGYEIFTRTESNSYANINEAVDQVSNFVLMLEKDLKQKIKQIKDFAGLESKLLNAVFNVLQNNNMLGDLEKEEILFPIRKAVNGIQLPEIKFKAREYENKIISQFSDNQIKNDDITKLQRLMRGLINSILDDVEKLLDSISEEIISTLDKVNENFVNNVLKESEQKLFGIKEQLKEKEKYIAKYQSLLTRLQTDIKNY